MQWYNYDYKMITDMITSIIGLSTGAEFDIVEQQLQIVWQLRKGSTITPNVLMWLVDTIRAYDWQLSADRMTESDHCEEGKPSAPTLFHFVKQLNES
jgi:hypothetical protein